MSAYFRVKKPFMDQLAQKNRVWSCIATYIPVSLSLEAKRSNSQKAGQVLHYHVYPESLSLPLY